MNLILMPTELRTIAVLTPVRRPFFVAFVSSWFILLEAFIEARGALPHAPGSLHPDLTLMR